MAQMRANFHREIFSRKPREALGQRVGDAKFRKKK
jgi:hypothetical protein